MIRLEPWSDFAERALVRIEGLGVVDVKREVEEGIAQLWHCTGRDGRGGYVVTRLERRPSGLEWVLVAGVGRGFYEFAQVFMDVAREAGVSVRAHVNRPGLVRMYERIGFGVSECVMRRC